MNLFFDEVSQKLIINAKKEMFELKHPYVGSEHLLLAILNCTDLDITKILNDYGITYEKFKYELIRTVGVGSKANDWFLFTPLLKRVINNATYFSKDNNKNVTPYCLFISILQEGDGVANRILIGMNVDLNFLYNKFLSYESLSSKEDKTKLLNSMAVNMNECSKSGKYDPVIGRDKQIDFLIQVLLRKNKNNPLLIGDAGVGKTAIVEELARRVVTGSVPLKLKNIVIYNISMSTLVAGTKYRGEFEDRINKLILELKNSPNVILFIDEIHTLMGAGGAEGAIDASNIVKPFLARGEIKIIGATTIDEYSKYIAKDKAFDRRFQKIYVDEPNNEEVKNILLKLKPLYENYHNVNISEDILDYIIQMSGNCIFTGKQPDKSIDLLDELCSFSSIRNNHFNDILSKYERNIKEMENKKNNEIINHNFKKAKVYKDKEMNLRTQYNNQLFYSNYLNTRVNVTRGDLDNVLCSKARVSVYDDFSKQVMNSFSKLKNVIFGQDSVIKELLFVLSKYDYIQINRPLTFLLVGKSGVGKTFLVDKIVEILFFNSNYIRLNMSEFSDAHSLTKIIGVSPGYVGYSESSIFDSILTHPFSIVLLDNIDKANKKIIKILLQAFDSGYIMNSKGKKIFLKKCIIFMTTSVSRDSIGFINHSSDISFDWKNKIKHILFFNDITKKSLSSYLKYKFRNDDISSSELKRLLEDIYSKVDIAHNGFIDVDDYLEKSMQ